MRDYVTAPSGEVEAHLDADTRTVMVNGHERYEVPLVESVDNV
jgi:hypothetical protein